MWFAHTQQQQQQKRSRSFAYMKSVATLHACFVCADRIQRTRTKCCLSSYLSIPTAAATHRSAQRDQQPTELKKESTTTTAYNVKIRCLAHINAKNKRTIPLFDCYLALENPFRRPCTLYNLHSIDLHSQKHTYDCCSYCVYIAPTPSYCPLVFVARLQHNTFCCAWSYN